MPPFIAAFKAALNLLISINNADPSVRQRSRRQQVQAGLAGLEPTTYGLGNRRSIRLSYSPMTVQPIASPKGLCVT